MANTPIAVMLPLAFTCDFSIILNFLVYSIFSLSFICWCCIPSLFSIPRYLYVFSCSSSCISLVLSSLSFFVWTNFSFFQYSLCALVKSKFHVDIITEGSNYLQLFLEFFPLFYLSASNRPCKVTVILVFVVCSL